MNLRIDNIEFIVTDIGCSKAGWKLPEPASAGPRSLFLVVAGSTSSIPMGMNWLCGHRLKRSDCLRLR